MKFALPAATEVGLTDISVGSGLSTTGCGSIVNVCAADVPPPGAGLKTVTLAAPAVATSAAVIAACSCPAETNVVVLSAPFQRTIEPGMKSLPLTVNVKAESPSVAAFGFNAVRTGSGLLIGCGSIVNDCAADVPPPGAGLKTVTLAVPAVATSAAVIAACSCPAETNVVVLSAP
ncbi:MAG: hypothetical protein MI673_07080, partial [Thiotrichales bacterium]|nr:hypothetical protein [Thiotrichales bacterium]